MRLLSQLESSLSVGEFTAPPKIYHVLTLRHGLAVHGTFLG